jgi:hypothetical protein
MKPANTGRHPPHTAFSLGESYSRLDEAKRVAAAKKAGESLAVDPASLKSIAQKARTPITVAPQPGPESLRGKRDAALQKVGKTAAKPQTAKSVARPDSKGSSLVESSDESSARVGFSEESSSRVGDSEDSSSRVGSSDDSSASENADWASESASEHSGTQDIDGTQKIKAPPLAKQMPAKRAARTPSPPTGLVEGDQAKGKASLDAYFKGMLEKASGAKKKGLGDQLKDSAFRDNGPVDFMNAFRSQCKDFFGPMEAAIEHSFDASLIRKGVKPKPAFNAGRKQSTEAEQQALDQAMKNFDLGPMARFGKKLAHTLVAPLSVNARIKARLKGESFSAGAARAAFEHFPAGGKAMLKDVVASFWKLDDFHKLTPTEQEKTLRDAVTACIVTYGANKVSLDTVKKNLTGQPALADGISAMALAQTYLKASFGLQHAVTGDSGAIANLVSGSEKKRASAFIDLLLEDACHGYVSTIVDPYSAAYVATANQITSTMLKMVTDQPKAVDAKVKADVPRMAYALVSKSGTVDLSMQAGESEKQAAARTEKVWEHIGHETRHAFRRRIALCATQELKNAVINLAFESDGRFLQDYPGCLPRLDMKTKVSIERNSNDKTTVRLEGSFDGHGKSVELKRGGFDTIGKLTDFRMHYVMDVAISDLHGAQPIKLGPIRFTMENLTVHPAV